MNEPFEYQAKSHDAPVAPDEDSGRLELVPRRPRATDDVYDTLRTAILSKRLRPGTRLSVPSLADELGVSRSPVREAVQKLVQQGLATEEAHRGAVVALLDPVSILNLYELRQVLESLAARLACERATEEELANLASILNEHADALAHEDYRRHMQLDMRFHAAIRSAARNEHLEAALERVQDKVAIAMLSADISWPQHALTEHEIIRVALCSRDPDKAAAAAETHITRLRKDLMALLHERSERPLIAERLEARKP